MPFLEVPISEEYASLKTFELDITKPFNQFVVVNGVPKDKKSFIGCLWRYADGLGYKVIFTKDTKTDSRGDVLEILLISLEEKKIK